MVGFYQNVRLLTRSVESERICTELTDPLQLPVDEVEAVKVLQPMCDIYQLRKPVSYRCRRGYMGTHKLDSVNFWVSPDEVVDSAVIHPF